MTVKELIKTLKTYPADLPVVYRCCSEYHILEAHELSIEQLHPTRADGWVHDYFDRDDPQRVPYLAFPGN